MPQLQSAQFGAVIPVLQVDFARADARLTQGLQPEELGLRLGELLLIDRYKRGDLSLGEVSLLLHLYPDIDATTAWLNQQGVAIGASHSNETTALRRAHRARMLRTH